MRRLFSILTGLLLILSGIFGMMWLAQPPGSDSVFRALALRFWPVLVLALSAFFVLPPLLVRDRPGLSGLFIPGMLILTTGGLLLLASLTGGWGFVWSRLWPLEVLALALAFLFMALCMHSIGLTVPAVILGFNGLALQLTALTGRWEAWAVLWILEPLAVGVALLVLNFKLRRQGLVIAGAILCGIAALSLLVLSFFFARRWWVIGLLGPALLVLLGGFCIIRALRAEPEPSAPPAIPEDLG